jgi:hypothetical protein
MHDIHIQDKRKKNTHLSKYRSRSLQVVSSGVWLHPTPARLQRYSFYRPGMEGWVNLARWFTTVGWDSISRLSNYINLLTPLLSTEPPQRAFVIILWSKKNINGTFDFDFLWILRIKRSTSLYFIWDLSTTGDLRCVASLCVVWKLLFFRTFFSIQLVASRGKSFASRAKLIAWQRHGTNS